MLHGQKRTSLLRFMSFDFLSFRIVSCFGFRYSNLGFYAGHRQSRFASVLILCISHIKQRPGRF
jgi:hypothetical protein